jgi:hypothetical protein
MPQRATSRGAIYIETLVVLPVLTAFFFVTWQLFDLLTAHLVLRHAAVAAARAAAVIGQDAPNYYNDEPADDFPQGGARLGDVTRAAAQVVAAHPNLDPPRVTAEVGGDLSTVGVIVTSTYHCRYTLTQVVCGGAAASMSASATFAYQSADIAWDGRTGG